jgi:ABC-type lipoprotein export system ATPase subunit
MALSKCQLDAFETYKNGSNIFISGYAGTGKSYLINQIYTDAKQNGKNIQITAKDNNPDRLPAKIITATSSMKSRKRLSPKIKKTMVKQFR